MATPPSTPLPSGHSNAAHQRRAAVRAAPPAVRLALGLALVAQLGWQASHRAAPPQPQELPPPPTLLALRLSSLDESAAAARMSMLYLQSFDDQPGVSLAWRQLDYGCLQDWLQRALELDPRSQYPLLAASEVYGAVSDPPRVRRMLEKKAADQAKAKAALAATA